MILLFLFFVIFFSLEFIVIQFCKENCMIHLVCDLIIIFTLTL